jgi:hypothetical protein
VTSKITTRLRITVNEARLKLQKTIENGEKLLGLVKNSQSKDILLVHLQHFHTWDDFNKTLLEKMFSTSKILDEYKPRFRGDNFGPMALVYEIKDLTEKINNRILILISIFNRLELFELDTNLEGDTMNSGSDNTINNEKIFIVHGHDEAVKQNVARFIDRLGFNAIILHEQSNDGRTVIEKFEANSDVGFAIVLLTPDDIGGSKQNPSHLQDRARQNVILELGYFFGNLGRSKVCALYKGSVELPSDFSGIIYVPFDDAGGWKISLAKELKSAGYSVDMNKVI